MSVLNDSQVFYFRIPLNNIAFGKLPFQMTYKYAYCRYYSTSLLCQERPASNIIGVYDYLSDEPINDYSILLGKDWLFGEVLTYPPPLRGEAKWSVIGKMPIDSVNIRLPHFKFGKNDSWFYLKDGKYYLFAGVKAAKEKVNHLEHSNINAENTIKLRIIVELLKRESKSRKLEIPNEEWENIAFMVLRSEYIHRKDSDERIREFVSNLLPDMLNQSIYSEIPPEIRGTAVE
ncbi:hypothetical protein [uncultured Chitinophaga sp.]|jgi:hypothetical protein|uniref:hypothetical protein n=1 Tax=uncultured Chitinophaga sp. TaxID=339340 RepID=UPI00261A9CB3|nr:hypothetical protein [uncultured Chitinophaga sp.]